jgi:hypothetical protein
VKELKSFQKKRTRRVYRYGKITGIGLFSFNEITLISVLWVHAEYFKLSGSGALVDTETPAV